VTATTKQVIKAGLLILLVAISVGSEAQQGSGKIARIGFLGTDQSPATMPREKAFYEGLRHLGWIESQNLTTERRYWENRAERLPVLVDELVRRDLETIVTTSGTAAWAVKKVTNSTPIVMISSADAVSQGLVASLARPGGNVTGLTNISTDVIGKQLEILKEAFPRVSRVAVLYCPASGRSITETRWSEIEAAAQTLKVYLQPIEVSGPGEVDRALRSATAERADAIFVHDCSVIPTKAVELIMKTKLPAIYPTSRFAEAGALMVYGPSGTELARRAAYFVDKILKGAKPADLPIEQPTKFELIINLKTAKQMGLAIPPNVLARADRIIK
jgi:putative tryptophan/tyrosine transport system substrate-binding protein